MSRHEPMVVTIHTTEHGSSPEPAYDESWPERDRVRWLAGLVKARTGIEVTTSESDRSPFWNYQVGGWAGAGSFALLWDKFMGFIFGVEERDKQLRELAIDGIICNQGDCSWHEPYVEHLLRLAAGGAEPEQPAFGVATPLVP